MNKTEINGGENIKEAKQKFLKPEDLRSRPRLAELVDKHGTVYVIMPDGIPLKVTRAKLV